MHHFFVDPSQVLDEKVTIKGNDVNHIKNVLRMKVGEELLISNGIDMDYYCKIESISDDEIVAVVLNEEFAGTELPCEIYLFQGLPKSDKMELIIQKAVELGAKAIVPVATKRCVVKLDDKKEASKLKRWQAISESAAKQSRRVIIPEVMPVMSFKEAINLAKTFDLGIIPYENFKDMEETRNILSKLDKGMKIGIFIGPEGGFDDSEISYAMENGVKPISLGKRILRTETAGLAILSVIMFRIEEM
ncbi:MAG: 16S rRNA (uracil(1498)-N(3))-methyltransferase [Lachnospiraceae bacterium]|nr:16S rRNA (uracil(1498)-N(3))-methyltransferase [Lachnospiraceae bacterium]